MSTRADYASVRTLEEALELLQSATERSALLAGGTDLMVEFETGRTRPDRVIDLHHLDELRGIGEEPAGLRIGALTTCTELLESPLVCAYADILVAAADEVGAEQIKNRATLGGNLGTASPAADLNPVLLALKARVRLASSAGRRELPVDRFLCGYRETARRSDELIESVVIPRPLDGERHGFRKVGTRRAQSIAKLVLAISLRVVEGEIRDVRAAAGSVAAKTVLLPSAALELEGKAPNPSGLRESWRRAVKRDVTPIGDVRSSAEYRREVLFRVGTSMLIQLTSN